MKSNMERAKFFQGLTERLLVLPESLIANQLAALLLSRMVLLDRAAVHHFLPHFLTPNTKGINNNCLFKSEATIVRSLFERTRRRKIAKQF
jgi:hypothetical protein